MSQETETPTLIPTPRVDRIKLDTRKDDLMLYVVSADKARELERELIVLQSDVRRLVEKANAVIERWDAPLWKGKDPNAWAMNSLRDELASFEANNPSLKPE